MPTISCPNCKQGGVVRLSAGTSSYGMELSGVLRCLYDGHKWPIVIRKDVIQSIQTSMAVAESGKLTTNVPDGIVQDIEEAERAHFAFCFKACVVMCRRALQLALEDKGAKGRTLGPLLTDARSKTPPILTPRVDALAEGIKDYGDSGAHRTDDIDASTAALVVHITVVALTELYP